MAELERDGLDRVDENLEFDIDRSDVPVTANDVSPEIQEKVNAVFVDGFKNWAHDLKNLAQANRQYAFSLSERIGNLHSQLSGMVDGGASGEEKEDWEKADGLFKEFVEGWREIYESWQLVVLFYVFFVKLMDLYVRGVEDKASLVELKDGLERDFNGMEHELYDDLFNSIEEIVEDGVFSISRLDFLGDLVFDELQRVCGEVEEKSEKLASKYQEIFDLLNAGVDEDGSEFLAQLFEWGFERLEMSGDALEKIGDVKRFEMDEGLERDSFRVFDYLVTLKEREPGVEFNGFRNLGGAKLNMRESAFGRMLSNLIANAKQSVSEVGDNHFVKVNVSIKNGWLYVKVIDNGEGMNEKFLTELKAAMRSGERLSSKETGTGLGMSEVYQVVEKNRGIFDITSSPGKGTEVTVSFVIQY